jgi:type I restriction enzyme S subunit
MMNNGKLKIGKEKLPAGWEVKKLGEIYSFKNGINFDKTQKNGNGILTLDVLNMYCDGLKVNVANLYRIDKQISEDYILKNGDILIVRSSVKEEGVAWATFFEEGNEPITFCGFIIRGRPVHTINAEYVVYYLRSHDVRNELIKKSVRSTITNINQAILSEVNIPLPLLSEQKRIVSILDEAFEKIAKAKENTEKNLQNARELFESYLQSVFENKGDGSASAELRRGKWEEKTLDQISENLDSKRIPITKNIRSSGSIPYYGASGIVDYVKDYIFDDDLLCVSEDGANLLARTYPIAFSISGKTWVNNHAHILRFENIASQRFVEYYLNSIKLEDHVSGMAQPKLNQTMLNRIPIPFPSLPEQQRIVAKFDALSAEVKKLEGIYKKRIADFEEMKKSILEKAFKGELN